MGDGSPSPERRADPAAAIAEESPAPRPEAEPQRPPRLMNRLRALFGLRNGESVRETIEELIEERDESDEPLEADERQLLKNILRMRDTTAYDVMVPRAHIVAIALGTTFDDLVKLMIDAAHSRLPVYRESLDDVVGMIHIKDVLAASKDTEPVPLERLLRKVLFVPPSLGTLDLLLQMRTTRTHLALVVDEYGGIDGLVTIEDLVEEIVGEIEDEHDDEEAPPLERRADGTLIADAGLALEHLEQLVGPFLSDEEQEDIDTVGGLVTTIAGRVPQAGEVIAHPSGIEFEVLAADARRIERLRLRNLPPARADS